MMGVVSELAISDTDKGKFLREYFEKDWKTTEYNYRNEGNSLAFTVVRADAPIGKKKEIRPFGPDQSFGYPNANKKASRPLYNLPELLHKKSGQRVFVVEGEKCADACADAYPGDIFLTWASGNKAIDYTDWKPLETDTVYLVCDTDESGRAAMRKVYDKLVKLYCTVRIYSVEGNDKRDIADWIDDCQTATEREALRQTIIDEALDPKSRSDAVGAAGKAIEFAEIEPCEEIVDGQELLTDLSDIIKRHMSIFPYQADTVALWIVMAHIHEHSEIETAPFLNITSPTKRAGKTTLLTIIKEFVPRPLPLTDYSTSALFRVIEKYHPTLLLDEIDLKGSNKADDNGELSALLNGSQSRETAYILRSMPSQTGNKSDWEPMTFDTWCPKVLSGIRGLRDTTLDRSTIINLARKRHTDKLPRWRNRDRIAILELHSRVVRWTGDCQDKIVRAREEVRERLPEYLNDRECDTWELLLALAHVAGKDWFEKGISACVEISKTADDKLSYSEILIGDLKLIYQAKDNPEFMPSHDILEALNWREDRPWQAWSRGHPMTAHALSKLLKDFGVAPFQKKNHGQPIRGYELTDLTPIFNRYSVTGDGKSLENIEKNGNGSDAGEI